jgi:hypothetical protein
MSVPGPPQTDRDALLRYLVAFPADAKIYGEGEMGNPSA